MKDAHVVGKKMTRNAGKMAKLIGCAFHLETEFTYPLHDYNHNRRPISRFKAIFFYLRTTVSAYYSLKVSDMYKQKNICCFQQFIYI